MSVSDVGEHIGAVIDGILMVWAADGVKCSGLVDHRKRGIIDGFIGIIGGACNITPIVGGIPGIGAIKPEFIGARENREEINGNRVLNDCESKWCVSMEYFLFLDLYKLIQTYDLLMIRGDMSIFSRGFQWVYL